jgi:hypothetical protein
MKDIFAMNDDELDELTGHLRVGIKRVLEANPKTAPLLTPLDKIDARDILKLAKRERDGEPAHDAGKEAEELRAGIERILNDDYRNVSAAKTSLQLLLDKVDARDSLAFLERNKLRPIKDAPKTATWVLAWTTDRYGNKQWLPVHWAQGGGEEQPPFRGWFYRFADGHSQIEESRLLGWVPLPTEPK